MKKLEPPVGKPGPKVASVRSDPLVVFAAKVAERKHIAHLVVAGLLFVAVVWTLLATCQSVGYARDEGFYFNAARHYAEWFHVLGTERGLALRREVVDASFSVNHEHPAFVKSLFALSYLLLQKDRALFAHEGTSFRFPAMVLAAAMIAVTYLWGAKRSGFVAGIAAAASLFFMPRIFFHAHLACFDVPIAAMFLLTLYACDRALAREGMVWPIATGVLFGLALDTKHNSWFLPFAVVAHGVVTAVSARILRKSVRAAVRRHIHVLGAMAVLGPLVLYLGWPWLWFDTRARLSAYAEFHLHHDYYNMEFFGETYWEPPMPRTYAPVMTIATVPTVTLAAATIGFALFVRSFVRSLRARDEETLVELATPLLWTLAIVVSYAAWLRSSTPIFGGTKHWMTAYPFLALFAGEGIKRAAAAIREELEILGRARAGVFASAAAVVVCIASPMEQALAAHPFGLSAYTPIVGGAPGAATLGLNRTFWGYTTGSLVDYLNREVPPNGRVYPHDTLYVSWDMLKRDGKLRPDIQAVGSAEEADIALYHHEMHMQGQEYQAWIAFGTVRPDVVAGLDGVPVIWAYKRKPRP